MSVFMVDEKLDLSIFPGGKMFDSYFCLFYRSILPEWKHKNYRKKVNRWQSVMKWNPVMCLSAIPANSNFEWKRLAPAEPERKMPARFRCNAAERIWSRRLNKKPDRILLNDGLEVLESRVLDEKALYRSDWGIFVVRAYGPWRKRQWAAKPGGGRFTCSPFEFFFLWWADPSRGK